MDLIVSLDKLGSELAYETKRLPSVSYLDTLF